MDQNCQNEHAYGSNEAWGRHYIQLTNMHTAFSQGQPGHFLLRPHFGMFSVKISILSYMLARLGTLVYRQDSFPYAWVAGTQNTGINLLWEIMHFF